MADKEYTGKESMLENWNKVMVSILVADNGVSNIIHVKDGSGNVVGLKVEMVLKFDELLSPDYIENSDTEIENIIEEMAKLNTDKDVFTSKQRMIIEWLQIKNSILKAQTCEMKFSSNKNEFAGGGIFEIIVELDLKFYEALPADFTEDEKAVINDALVKRSKK